jgi:branched-chain amino acid aminotransferase
MTNVDVAPGAAEALKDFVPHEKLGFGAVSAPVMFSVEWRDQQWSRGRRLQYGPIEVWPGSRALHYADLDFEQLKAYRVGQPHPNFFRATENCSRLQRPAQRLSMPRAADPFGWIRVLA